MRKGLSPLNLNDYQKETDESAKVAKGKEENDSPTSLNMKQSFIFKNANKSFDRYFVEMKKRNAAKSLAAS